MRVHAAARVLAERRHLGAPAPIVAVLAHAVGVVFLVRVLALRDAACVPFAATSFSLAASHADWVLLRRSDQWL